MLEAEVLLPLCHRGRRREHESGPNQARDQFFLPRSHGIAFLLMVQKKGAA
jgi:hypothetical protein